MQRVRLVKRLQKKPMADVVNAVRAIKQCISPVKDTVASTWYETQGEKHLEHTDASYEIPMRDANGNFRFPTKKNWSTPKTVGKWYKSLQWNGSEHF